MINSPSMSRLFEVQSRVAGRVELVDRYSTEYVAGVDQAFIGGRILSGAVLLGDSMEVIGRARCRMREAFLSISGLLFFREGPAAIRAEKNLSIRPSQSSRSSARFSPFKQVRSSPFALSVPAEFYQILGKGLEEGLVLQILFIKAGNPALQNG